ncbi:hypothetical protein CH063_01472 [Colletotrichum higginsianum]|uniref:Uncharacterized protein n=1 Tax=Colletotrichum higginsianum (strain IMI 349063) TaxID=759273 RepID=H1V7W2_COLHI|nr:hypothetical protein CH063_01472 [Colletotrichum higginsianum]
MFGFHVMNEWRRETQARRVRGVVCRRRRKNNKTRGVTDEKKKNHTSKGKKPRGCRLARNGLSWARRRGVHPLLLRGVCTQVFVGYQSVGRPCIYSQWEVVCINCSSHIHHVLFPFHFLFLFESHAPVSSRSLLFRLHFTPAASCQYKAHPGLASQSNACVHLTSTAAPCLCETIPNPYKSKPTQTRQNKTRPGASRKQKGRGGEKGKRRD